MKALGWFEHYRCGCVSETFKRKRDLRGYCAIHGADRQEAPMPVIEPERRLIHDWFELTYAQYLTIPRTALQSMPEKWQTDFVKLLDKLDESIDWRPKEGRYWVQLRGPRGEFLPIFRDPLMDYERGRRRVLLKS